MTKRSAVHGSFTIDRTYPAPVAKVFAAWATKEAKAKWFAGPEGVKETVNELDFRVGGRERNGGLWPDGRTTMFNCLYHDIVPDKRIVTSYDMHINDALISVSLATIEFEPTDGGTRLIVTEQGAFLDGYDDAGSREHGTRWLLDKLGDSLK